MNLNQRKLELRREELFRYYRNKAEGKNVRVVTENGSFREEIRNVEEEKKSWVKPLSDLLPKNIVKIQHEGPLRVLAFSDYRVHDISALSNFVRKLKEKPDLIVYAGDDIERFAPPPLEYLDYQSEKYPEELGTIWIKNLRRGISSSKYGFLLRIPKHMDQKEYARDRLLTMTKVTSRLYEALKAEGPRNKEELEKLVANESPSLSVIEKSHKGLVIVDRGLVIVDSVTGTEILRVRRNSGGRLIPSNANYLLLRKYQLDKSPKKIREDKSYAYYYVPTNGTDHNVFEELATNARYGLLAIIGNANDDLERLWIRGRNVYDLHTTWVKVGPFLFVGLEGSTCGMGPSGKYLEGDLKLRLELAQQTLRHGEKLVVVSHTPPRGVLDRAVRFGDKAIGSLALRDFLEEEGRTCLVICGHVHRCGGQYERLNNTTVINVSSHDDSYSRANVAWVNVEPSGDVRVTIYKLPSLIEFLIKRGATEEEISERAFLSENEAFLLTGASRTYGHAFFDRLESLAQIKFRYGLPWKIVFMLYEHGVVSPEELTEGVFKELFERVSGLFRFHLQRAYVKFMRERNGGSLYLLAPPPSYAGDVIFFDTEYNQEKGILYGFLDSISGEVKQFWFNERERAIEYLSDKKEYTFVHWGGKDKKLLREELYCEAPSLNLLYYVQTSLVAPVNSASLKEIHDALCGHTAEEWWKRYFYEMDGLYKLVLCNGILNNPSDAESRKMLSNANRADLIALSKITKKLAILRYYPRNSN